MKVVRLGAVVLTATLAGVLLSGCTSEGGAPTMSSAPAASTKPSASAALSLAGTWIEKEPRYASVGVLKLSENPRTWSYKGGVYAVTQDEGHGSYEVAGDTITWLGGCEEDEDWEQGPGVYTYTLDSGTLALSVTDDPCGLRSRSFDDQTFTLLAASPSPPSTNTSSPNPRGSESTSLASGALPAVTLKPADGDGGELVGTKVGILEWQGYGLPDGYDLPGLVPWILDPIWATAHGWVAARRGAPEEMWWSQDSVSWEGVLVGHEVRVVRDGEDIVLLGEPAVRYVWDGQGWAPGPELQVPAAATQVVFAGDDVVALTEPDGQHPATEPAFDVSHDRGATFRPPSAAAGVQYSARSAQETRLLPTSTGFLALTGTGDAKTEAWTSASGDAWIRPPEPLPWGPLAVLDVQSDGARVAVAVGTRSSLHEVWSSDDGVEWRPAAFAPESPALVSSRSDAVITPVGRGLDHRARSWAGGSSRVPWFRCGVPCLYVGELGWLMLGEYHFTGEDLEEYGPESFGSVMWTSADARRWDNHPVHVSRPLAVGADTIFGHGEPSGQGGSPESDYSLARPVTPARMTNPS